VTSITPSVQCLLIAALRSLQDAAHPSESDPEAEIGPPHKRPSVGGSRPYARLVLISARIVHHGRYVVFQLAELAVPRVLFAETLRWIDRIMPRPLLT
jgi:hypothetical protein